MFVMLICFCTIFVFLNGCDAVKYRITEIEYHKMPPLYAMDDYNTCMIYPGATYCVIDVDLQAGSNKDLMRMIQEYSNHTKKHYNHTQIHRGVCVTSTCKDFLENNTINEMDLDKVLEACLNNSVHTGYGLEGRLSDIQYCYKKDETLKIDTSDIIMAVVYLVLILLNAVGSLYDVMCCNEKEKSGNPYLLAFSLRKNWARLTASSSNPKEPRLERLKSFNGLRTLSMFSVLLLHTSLAMSISYIDNPLYIEANWTKLKWDHTGSVNFQIKEESSKSVHPVENYEAYDDPVKQLLLNSIIVTQTFFLMSSFLLAYNFMLHLEKHPVSWTHLSKRIVLRWLRLTPTYALVLGTVMTWMRHMHRGPMWSLAVISEADTCRQYWWAHLLYINNYVDDDAWCMPETWYLAADLQLYLLGLLVCVFARSCKAKVVTLTGLMVVGLAIVAGQTYFADLEAVVIHSPESFRNLYATNDTSRLVHTRGYTNISTYVLGLATGFLTYRWQTGKGLDKYKKYRWVSWLCFPLGTAVILSGGLFYRDEERAPIALRVPYATFHKPIFSLVIIGIIISSVFKLENVYRGILEWRGFTWTGKVSYNVFLLHALFQRGLIGVQTRPTHMSDYYVVTVLAATIFLSYLSAAILWLILEAPADGLTRTVLESNNNRRDDQSEPKVKYS